MLLSDFLKNGTSMQSPAGVNAINVNDLLLLNATGKLYPATISDFAASANIGTTLIAATTVSSYVLNAYSHKEIFTSLTDGGLYSSFPATTSNCGIGVAKYNTAGALVKSITIDSTANCSLQGSAVQQLSNGNILVTWCFQGGANAGTWFAIYDQLLNQVVAPVKVTALNGIYHDSIPLSGGGFAIAYQLVAGMTQAIYSNAGAVVSAATTVTGSPISGSAPRLAQLSSGNIAIAICSTVAGNALGHAIITAAGAGVQNYAVLDAATIAATTWPEIAAAAGFYACAITDGANTKGYVLSNVGALQGAPFSVANTYVEGLFSKKIRLLTDGTAFWLVYCGSGGNAIVYMPTSGTGYVSNPAVSMDLGDAFLDRGNIVIFASSIVTPYLIGANGTVSVLPTSTSLALTPYVMAKPAGDFTVMLCSGNQAGGMQFGLTKYQNASIVGIAQATLAAGNGGTTIPFSMGPGGYPCNQLLGTLSKAFDHTASNIIANKGVLLGVSAALRGI